MNGEHVERRAGAADVGQLLVEDANETAPPEIDGVFALPFEKGDGTVLCASLEQRAQDDDLDILQAISRAG